jgi:hypothetical protein
MIEWFKLNGLNHATSNYLLIYKELLELLEWLVTGNKVLVSLGLLMNQIIMIGNRNQSGLIFLIN